MLLPDIESLDFFKDKYQDIKNNQFKNIRIQKFK